MAIHHKMGIVKLSSHSQVCKFKLLGRPSSVLKGIDTLQAYPTALQSIILYPHTTAPHHD